MLEHARHTCKHQSTQLLLHMHLYFPQSSVKGRGHARNDVNKRRKTITCRYKEDQQREVQEAAEKAKLASMTDEERRRWELENPKVSTRHQNRQCHTASFPAKPLPCTASTDELRNIVRMRQGPLNISGCPHAAQNLGRGFAHFNSRQMCDLSRWHMGNSRRP